MEDGVREGPCILPKPTKQLLGRLERMHRKSLPDDLLIQISLHKAYAWSLLNIHSGLFVGQFYDCEAFTLIVQGVYVWRSFVSPTPLGAFLHHFPKHKKWF